MVNILNGSSSSVYMYITWALKVEIFSITGYYRIFRHVIVGNRPSLTIADVFDVTEPPRLTHLSTRNTDTHRPTFGKFPSLFWKWVG